MDRERDEARRRDVERELEERATDEQRQRRGSAPREDVMERALEIEPGVEQHAGEDPGVASETGERAGPGPDAHDPDRGEPE
jgi:hypothetical protein